MSIRLLQGGLWLLPLSACGGAAPSAPAPPPAPAAAAAPAPAAAPVPLAGSQGILGRWARSADECRRPELVFEARSATIQTDADGQPTRFAYADVRYVPVEPGQITVELGKAHPYGKTASATALTFRQVAPDEIDLAQGRRSVPFLRCAKSLP